MIVINFKNYVSGKKALKLAKKIEKYIPNAIVAVANADIELIKNNTKLKVYSEYIDNKNTPEAVKNAGAVGSLLNHSSHRIFFSNIKKTIRRCNKIGLKLIVCASSINEARKIMKLKPYAIAFEDPKLIGTGKSITKYKADDVKKFTEMLKGKGIIPLCGAGISSKEDIIEAKRLGCKGVLISSAIANARNDKLLRELAA